MQRSVSHFAAAGVFALLPFVGCAGPRAEATAVARPRLMAEWEPAQGTLVKFPFRIPDALVVDLAREGTLYVLARAEDLDAARARLKALDVPAERCEIVTTSADTHWTRDWGPHQVEMPVGERALVDHVFRGYPWVPANATVADFGRGPRRHAGDDAAAAELAAHLGARVVVLPAVATGGNLLTDGRGRAFCTQAQVLENAPEMDEARYRELLRDRMGVDDLVVLENTEEFGIQHVDCWMKVIDAETLLIKRAPEDHFEHAPIERNVELLKTLRTPEGRPYRILRIECPRYRDDRVAAYTNALLLNGVAHVPLFGVEADTQALATYRAALPGWNVRGYAYDGWLHFDALHCRVRALFADPRVARRGE